MVKDHIRSYFFHFLWIYGSVSCFFRICGSTSQNFFGIYGWYSLTVNGTSPYHGNLSYPLRAESILVANIPTFILTLLVHLILRYQTPLPDRAESNYLANVGEVKKLKELILQRDNEISILFHLYSFSPASFAF